MQLKITIALILLVCTPSLGASTQPVLSFKPTKTGGWSLKKEFLNEIKQLFDREVFIESGTSYGTTVERAKDLFERVYSIELDENLYMRALDKFAIDENVYLYLGDSAILMGPILNRVKDKKVILWLDGHFSGDDFGAHAKATTPIVEELAALKQSGIADAVIMIDDICCFNPPVQHLPDVAQGFPTVSEIKKIILDINPHYEFIVYGDIAIAYPSHYKIKVSPLVRAMTVSRLYDGANTSYLELFQAEHDIASLTTATELEALWDMCTYHFGAQRTYAYLWYALSLFTQQRYAEAYDNFKIVTQTGYNHWRVSWYGAQAAYRAGKEYAEFTEQLKDVNDLSATKYFFN